jgi:hypothetical protein
MSTQSAKEKEEAWKKCRQLAWNTTDDAQLNISNFTADEKAQLSEWKAKRRRDQAKFFGPGDDSYGHVPYYPKDFQDALWKLTLLQNRCIKPQ